jgi:hypothetical protein
MKGNIMREALIILPVKDNNGRSIASAHSNLATRLIDAFGGLTTRAAQGAWVDHGKLYREDVTEYVVAYEPTAFNDETLREIAIHAGHEAKQLAIYTRFASGDVEIIDTAPAHAEAA